MGTLRYNCAKVRELSDLRFGVVNGVGRGIGVLDRGPRPARRRGGCGFFVPQFLTLDFPIRWLFNDVFSFKIKFGVYEKLAKKVTAAQPKHSVCSKLQREAYRSTAQGQH